MFHFKSIKLSILCVIPIVFLFMSYCNKLDPYEEDIKNLNTQEENIQADDSWSFFLSKILASRHFTPVGSILPTSYGPPNCHAFAWQYNCGVPNVNDIPGYFLASPSAFWFDGSFKLIAEGNARGAIPTNVQVGDKVVYSRDAHSAIVYSTNPHNPLFISYTIGSSKARIHHPDDPGGSFGGALNYYHVSRSDYCTTSPPTTTTNTPRMVTMRDGLLLMERREDDYIYYARMLNSNDKWRFRWNLNFYDSNNKWVGSWERRETTTNASQHTGIYFYQNYRSATKMVVKLTVTNIYGRGCNQITEVRYK